jgi:hypothetical protein
MEICIIQSFQHLTTDGIPKPGLEIENNFRLGRDLEVLAAFIETYKFEIEIGRLEVRTFAENPHYAYALTRYQAAATTADSATTFIRWFTIKSQLFQLALWMVKDNSCNTSAAFLCVKESRGQLQYVSDRTNVVYFDTECRFRGVHFTQAELGRAIEFFHHFDRVIPKVKQKVNDTQRAALTHQSRIGRALYFAQAARGQNEIGLKAAFYSMAFESLFSTDTTGVNHRIAERSALFIGEPGQNRRDVYKDVHDLYNFRSTVVHGSPIKGQDLGKLLGLVKRCDQHLRVTITKIIEDADLATMFSKNDPDGIRAHFFQRLFPIEMSGAAPPPTETPPPASAGGTPTV